MTLVLTILTSTLLSAQDVPRPRIVGVPHVASRPRYRRVTPFLQRLPGIRRALRHQRARRQADYGVYQDQRPSVRGIIDGVKPGRASIRALGLETDNAEGLRQYVQSKGYKISAKPASKGRIKTPLPALTIPTEITSTSRNMSRTDPA